MEITEFKKKLKSGQASIKLLDTGFSQLTRKITSDPGANYLTAVAADPLSKEVIVSLNQAQLDLRSRYETLFSAYNTWVIGKQASMPNLETFDYEFSAVEDYSGGYEPDITSADYYMLTSIINAEKELYEAGNYWFMNNLESNIDVVKEWSKNRNYGSTTSKVIGYFETGWNKYPGATWPTNPYGLTITNVPGSSDKVWVHVGGLETIPDGVTVTIKVVASYETGPNDDQYTVYEYAYMYIKRNVIDGDSYLTCWASKGDFHDHGRIDSYVRTGNSATHFNTVTPSFSWLNNRTYI